MSPVKIFISVLAVILAIFITYNAVVMITTIEPASLIETLVKGFIIFSILYTCGKLIPYFLLKVFAMKEVLSCRRLKNASKNKPFN
jgi:hypothetical protein